jgi:protein TonB
MKRDKRIAVIAAILVHAGLLCFGGLILFHEEKPAGQKVDDVALVDEAKEKEEEKPKIEEEIEKETEPLPEMPPEQAAAPEPLSLSELEVALNPGGDGGDGAFASTFRLGAARNASQADIADMDSVFSMADLDQKPRPLFQVTPTYPLSLRQKKVAGSVVVLFVVDKQGKVASVQVENSTDPAFEKPAVDAVKQWKFEPGVRGGQKVNFKMKVPIRFAV